jgi:hypothetical protein
MLAGTGNVKFKLFIMCISELRNRWRNSGDVAREIGLLGRVFIPGLHISQRDSTQLPRQYLSSTFASAGSGAGVFDMPLAR